MIKVDFDETQAHRALQVKVASPYEGLGFFLASDLQTVSSVRDQVAHLRAVVAGSAEPEEYSGNAFAVLPKGAVTLVEGLYGEPPLSLEVPTADLIELLEQWEVFLRAHGGDDAGD